MSLSLCPDPRLRFVEHPSTKCVHISITLEGNAMGLAIHMLTETPGEIVTLAPITVDHNMYHYTFNTR